MRIIFTLILSLIIFFPSSNYSHSADNLEVSNKTFPPTLPSWKTEDNFNKTLKCLTRNIFYESPRYSKWLENQYGIDKKLLNHEIKIEWLKIANVTRNRVKSSDHPDNYCDVIYQRSQFSWTLESWKVKNDIEYLYADDPTELANYNKIKEFAKEFLLDVYPNDVTSNSTFYHAHYVDPKWGFTQVASTRWHIYYKY